MSLRRTVGVALLQIAATLVMLIPILVYATAGDATLGYLTRHPLVEYGVLSLFVLGVFLHWVIAKTTAAHSRWVWWFMFTSSILMMTQGLVGMILGGLTLWRLCTSETSQRMRTGGVSYDTVSGS